MLELALEYVNNTYVQNNTVTPFKEQLVSAAGSDVE